MATYFVSSSGDNTTGLSWATAYTSLQTALTAASSGSDVVVIQYDGVPSADINAGDTTYTGPGVSFSLISASNDGGTAYTPTPMGDTYFVGNSSTVGQCRLSVGGAGTQAYIYGVTFRAYAAGTQDPVEVYGTSHVVIILDTCNLYLDVTYSLEDVSLGSTTTAGIRQKIILYGCKFRFNSTQQSVVIMADVEMYDCSVSSTTGQVPANLFDFSSNNDVGGSALYCEGCDWSTVGISYLVKDSGDSGSRPVTAEFVNCKVPASFGFLNSTSTYNQLTEPRVTARNCASGDTHYLFEVQNTVGSLVTQSTVYCNDGATYDGTNRAAWKVDTTAGATFTQPYKTPWIDYYWDGTSAIQPYIEVVRNGSATAWKDDEIWIEVSYQGTSGSTKATIVDDRCTLANHLAGSASNQASSSLGASDWTGENATAWFGKLQIASITPAEIGHLRARVCVAVNTSTTSLYVDPKIRT